MKQLLLILFSCFVIFASCAQPKQARNESHERDSVEILKEHVGLKEQIPYGSEDYIGTKLWRFISKFLLSHPNTFNNDLSMEKSSEQLISEIKNKLQEDPHFLNDIVVHIEGISKKRYIDKETGKDVTLVTFAPGYIDDFESSDKFDYTIKFSLVGTMPPEKAIEMRDDDLYFLEGNIVNFVEDDLTITKNKIYLGTFFIKNVKLIDYAAPAEYVEN